MRSSGNHDSEGPLTHGLRSRCRREAAAARPDTSAQACAGPGVRHGPRGGSGHRVGGPAASWSWGRRRAQRWRRSSCGKSAKSQQASGGAGAALKGGGDPSPPHTHFTFRGSPPNPFALRVVRTAVCTRGRGSGTRTPPGAHPRRGQRPRGAPGAQGAGGSAPGLPSPCIGQLSPCPSSEKFGGVWNAVPSVGSVLRWFRPQNFSLDSTCLGVPQG